jgi:hypothetical protein
MIVFYRNCENRLAPGFSRILIIALCPQKKAPHCCGASCLSQRNQAD